MTAMTYLAGVHSLSRGAGETQDFGIGEIVVDNHVAVSEDLLGAQG
jgi:hypothetical protein